MPNNMSTHIFKQSASKETATKQTASKPSVDLDNGIHVGPLASPMTAPVNDKEQLLKSDTASMNVEAPVPIDEKSAVSTPKLSGF